MCGSRPWTQAPVEQARPRLKARPARDHFLHPQAATVIGITIVLDGSLSTRKVPVDVQPARGTTQRCRQSWLKAMPRSWPCCSGFPEDGPPADAQLVASLLGISEKEAARMLDELEREGLVAGDL
jgi:hypothetical protein